MTFRKAPGSVAPCCHFAFDIPENKLPLAIEWMSKRRLLVLRNTLKVVDRLGRDIKSMDAFHRAVGNLREPRAG